MRSARAAAGSGRKKRWSAGSQIAAAIASDARASASRARSGCVMMVEPSRVYLHGGGIGVRSTPMTGRAPDALPARRPRRWLRLALTLAGLGLFANVLRDADVAGAA